MIKKTPSDQSWQEGQALARYQMTAPLLDETLDGAKRAQMREEAAGRYGISKRSLYRYEAAYRAGGFSGLKPMDRGAAVFKKAAGQLWGTACAGNPAQTGSAQTFREADHPYPGNGGLCAAGNPQAPYTGKAPVPGRVRRTADADGG